MNEKLFGYLKTDYNGRDFYRLQLMDRFIDLKFESNNVCVDGDEVKNFGLKKASGGMDIPANAKMDISRNVEKMSDVIRLSWMTLICQPEDAEDLFEYDGFSPV